MLSERIPHQSRTIALSLPRGPVRRLQEFLVQDNLDYLHCRLRSTLYSTPLNRDFAIPDLGDFENYKWGKSNNLLIS
jgi:hypothetical protein